MPQSNVGSNSTFGFAALAALVGLFSEEATLKLKQIAETVLSKSEPGKDSTAPPPKISGINPAIFQNSPVNITGTNFNVGLKVNFGGVAASVHSVTNTTILTTPPPHPIGPVDVEVINPDGHSDVLRGAFRY